MVFIMKNKINFMLMKKNFLLIMSLVILLCSNCTNNDNSIESGITIYLDSIQYVALKIGNIRYIPLETTDECILGYADKVLIRNNRIYVADFNQTMSLFVFDMSGKFLFKINRRGQGPGEYTSFRDFDLQNNEEIYMFDHLGKKLLIFDSEGNYLHNIIFEFSFRNFCLIENKIYISEVRGRNGKKVADLALYDIVNGETELLLDDEKYLYSIPLNNSQYKFYTSPNNTYYAPKLSETTFSVTKDSIIPLITIKGLPFFPKDLLERWLSETNTSIRSDFFRNTEYFIENSYIYETNDYISMQYVLGINSFDLLYNKQTKKAYKLLSTYFQDIGHYCIKGSTGIEFFSTVYFNNENDYLKKILASHEELKNVKEDDNPVIVIFDLDMQSPEPLR